MKRMLCIRFSNWPVQCLLRKLRADYSQATDLMRATHDSPTWGRTHSTSVAIHTALPGKSEDTAQLDEDVRYLRSLYPSARSGPTIVAVSMEAWQRGVRPGMPLAEARSMAIPVTVVKQKGRRSPTSPSAPASMPVEFHEWQPFQYRKELAAAAELTRRYAPIVGLDEMPVPDSLLLDITGCGHLYGGEAALAEALLRDLRTAGFSCRMAIAPNIATAWALTHVERPRPAAAARSSHGSSSRSDRRATQTVAESIHYDLPIQILPPGQHRAELNSLPVAAARLGLKDLEILQNLGIRSIGQLLSLPVEDLPSRLSSTAVQRIQQLSDVTEEFITPLPEANPVAASWVGDELATTLADFQYILSLLTEQIAEQLQRRRLACSSVACEFHCIDGTLVPLNGSVVKATQSAEMLHDILCLRIDTAISEANFEASLTPRQGNEDVELSFEPGELASLAFVPVKSVSMTAAVVPIPSARQKDLFSPEEHIVPQEELARLVSRLSSRLGTSAVNTVHARPDPRPEFSFEAVPVLPEDAAVVRQNQLDAAMLRLTEPSAEMLKEAKEISVPKRPLRLLETPLPLAASKNSFPTVAIVVGMREEMIRFEGPERFQTGWWTDSPCHRDYFRVETAAGSCLWIFRDLQTHAWYLHGIFD